MSRRPLFLALALALPLAASVEAASAADLMETYEMARLSDPQLSAAEASRLAIREGVAQARSSLLPEAAGPTLHS